MIMNEDYERDLAELKKEKPFAKIFLDKWLTDPLFSNWLAKIPNSLTRCFCRVCNSVIKVGRSELEKHAVGKKHCRLVAAERNAEQYLWSGKAERNSVKNVAVSSNLHMPSTSSKMTSNRVGEVLRGSAAITKRPLDCKSSIPDQPDASKLIQLLQSGSDDDYDLDYDDSEYVLLEDAQAQVVKAMRTEAAQSERQKKRPKLSESNDFITDLSQLEQEERLKLIQDRRKYEQNIYKLKLAEMQTRVQIAEEERKRAEELHHLRTAQLQLQISRENQMHPLTTAAEGDETLENGDVGDGLK